MEHKAEIENFLGQMSLLMEKCATIVGDAIIQTKAELMREYKEEKVDSWKVNEAITAWEEVKELAVVELKEEAVEGGKKALNVDEATIEQVETSRAQGGDQLENHQQQQQQEKEIVTV
ncbi:hypothetical protein ACOSP7_024608 [Xanthoceras sorbifolium]